MPRIELPETVRAGETRVLMLLHRRNRELLERWLDDTVVTLTAEAAFPDEFDACVLDTAAFARHREELLARKEAAGPEFLPYLLVVRERNRPTLSTEVREVVDEVLVIPANPTEFAIRLSGLLQARRQSLELREQKEREIASLERQNEQLEQFASIVSHDLRNPMTVLGGALELIGETGDVDPTYVEMATESLDRMESLTEGLLALARQGQSIRETEPTDFETAARRAWTLVDTGATLVVDGTCTLDADPERLSALLENLFRNAAEHATTDDGDGPIVHVGPTHDPVGFYVEDDGPGIPPAERDRVLEYGFTTATDGTGFGLAIVRSVAEAHGWTVRVGDAPRGGARLAFECEPPGDATR
jgi:signal transduction histidine kinase